MNSRRLFCLRLCAVLTAVTSTLGGTDGVAADSKRGSGVFRVSDQKTFDTAVKQARPGDTLVMTGGVWKDVSLRFRGTGEADAPITLRAETPGEVILSGTSRLSIVGRHLVVEGLLFKDDAPSAEKSSPVVSFRGDGTQSHYCRMTGCAVVDFSPLDKRKDTRWVSLYGTHNRVDHCCFHNKTNLGTTVVVWLNDPPDHEPNHHRIDHNRQTFNLGYGTGRKGQTMPPVDCVVANNLVLGGRSPLITVHDPAMTVTFVGNVTYGAKLGLPPTAGIRRLDPKLTEGDDGLWRPADGSPILGAAEGRFTIVVDDMDGQPRESPTDVGADHRSDQPVRRAPLAATDVGPPWLELPLEL